MHALNAFYGRVRFTDADFADWTAHYDAYYSKLGMPSARDWDAILANQENLVAYVLKKDAGMGTIYLPPGFVARTLETWGVQKLEDLVDPRVGCVFAFNANHIWLLRKVGNMWYKVDSIGGVRVLGVRLPAKQAQEGYMVVLSRAGMITAMQQIQKRVLGLVKRLAVRENDVCSRKSLNIMVLARYGEGKGISEYEVDLHTFYQYYGTVYPNHRSTRTFMRFFSRYQRHPGDINHLMKYVPCLLHFLCVCDPSMLYV